MIRECTCGTLQMATVAIGFSGVVSSSETWQSAKRPQARTSPHCSFHARKCTCTATKVKIMWNQEAAGIQWCYGCRTYSVLSEAFVSLEFESEYSKKCPSSFSITLWPSRFKHLYFPFLSLTLVLGVFNPVVSYLSPPNCNNNNPSVNGRWESWVGVQGPEESRSGRKIHWNPFLFNSSCCCLRLCSHESMDFFSFKYLKGDVNCCYANHMHTLKPHL